MAVHLYENADWNVRWAQSRKAHKRYIKLRDKYPNAALNAYIEYSNWFNYGHPLVTKTAKLSVKMDLAGEGNVPDMIELLTLELQIAKDNKSTKTHFDELEEGILFWTELAKDLESHGEDPAEFMIEFEISSEGLE